MAVIAKTKSVSPKVHANNGRKLGVFRRLAKHADSLLVVPEGHTLASGVNDGAPEGSASAGRSFVAVPDAELQDWLAQDLIEAFENGYRLSAAGRSWLRRQLASADAFQEQHQARAVREIEHGRTRRPAIIDETESPLAWLASRKDKNGVPLLGPFQFEAGERLRADYYYAGLTARVTANWDAAAVSKRPGGGGGNDLASLTDNVMAARQRVVRALAAVGPELSGVLVDVCCHLKGLEDAEKAEGWPQRSGKVVLQIALTRLARHYGLVSDSQHTAGLKRKLQHWGTEDYRPSIKAPDGSAA